MHRPRTALHALLVRLTSPLPSAALVACFALACAKQHPKERAPDAPAPAEPAWVTEARRHPLEFPPKDSRLFPGGFQENRGQVAGQANFIAQGGDRLLVINPAEVSLLLRTGPGAPAKKAPPAKKTPPARKGGTPPDADPDPGTWSLLSMRLIGANPAARGGGLHRFPGHTSYYLGKDPTKWLTDVPSFGEVQYQQIYPSTDVAYRRDQEDIEYVFRIAPGGNPAAIKLGFPGAERPRIEPSGELVVKVGATEFRHRKPHLYQPVNGRDIAVDGAFAVNDAGEVSFQVGPYDKKQTLVIDPTIKVEKKTFETGGFNAGAANAIAVDRAGYIYVTGYLKEVTVWSGSTVVLTSRALFVSKLDRAGNILVTKELSGTPQCPLQALPPAGQNCDGDDEGKAIAVDAAGNIYVTGLSSSIQFPTTANAYDTCWAGNNAAGCQAPPATAPDAVVIKLDASMTPKYVSFLGGGGSSSVDFGTGIAVDPSGAAVFVAGQTYSMDFPAVTSKGYPPPTIRVGSSDAFLARFDMSKSGASSLVFSTFLGGPGGDGATSLVWTNALFVGGWSEGNLPHAVDPSGASAAAHGQTEGFLARFETTGAVTGVFYIRGNQSDSVSGLAVDPAENVYVTGTTTSTTFGNAAPPAFLGTNLFVAKLHFYWKYIEPPGRILKGAVFDYTTLVGGPGEDTGNAIAVDKVGRAHVAGSTRFSPTGGQFPAAGTLQTPLAATNAGNCGTAANGFYCTTDAFVLRLTATGSLDYAGLLGGDDDDDGFAIALSAPERVLVGGRARGNFPDRPMLPNFPNTTHAFVHQIVSGPDLKVTKTCAPNPVHAGHPLICTLEVSNGGPETATNVKTTDRSQQKAQATSVPGCSAATTTNGTMDLSCQIGTLAPGAKVTLTYPVVPLQVGAFTNTVTVGGDDWTPEDNVAAATVTVVSDADVVVVTGHAPATLLLGDRITSTVWVGDLSSDAADQVVLTYELPASFKLTSATSPVGSCVTQGLTVTCPIGRLAAAPLSPQSVPITLILEATVEGKFLGVAKATSTANDPDLNNNTAQETFEVRAGHPNVGGYVQAVQRSLRPGGMNIVMEAELTNAGDGNAMNVELQQIAFTTTKGAGVVQLKSLTPLPNIPYIGAGTAKSYVITVYIPANVLEFAVRLGGVYQDALGAATTFKLKTTTITP